MHRAVVTGIGVICAVGRNLTEFEQALREGRDGRVPMHSPDPNAEPWDLRFTHAAQIHDYVATDHFAPK